MSITAISPAWQSYLDLNNDVKPYLQMPAASTSSDALLAEIVDMSCTWVQNWLGRPIAPTTFFRRFSSGSSYIALPYYPVLQVTSVTEFWGANGGHVLTEQTPENQGGSDVYQLDRLQGTVIRTFVGLLQRPWFPGTRNIEIEWQAGYNPVPADIRVATLQLIAHWWRQTQQTPRGGTMTPAGMEGQAQDAAHGGMFAGVPPETERLLSPYLQQGIG